VVDSADVAPVDVESVEAVAAVRPLGSVRLIQPVRPVEPAAEAEPIAEAVADVEPDDGDESPAIAIADLLRGGGAALFFGNRPRPN
jgi:hypothetical protein